MPSFEELRQSASAGLDRAKTAVGLANPEEQKLQEPASDPLDSLGDCCPKLTFQQRMVGFGVCFGLGYLITFMSFSFFVDLVAGNPVPFVVNYTLGNVLSLFASMFLCGPKRQFKNMWDEKRRYTSIVYLSCLFLTIVLIFIPMDSSIKLLLLVLLILAQFCASLWYTLSYIPYGRRTFLRMMKNCFGIEDDG